MVHLSTHCGEAIKSAMSLDRLSLEVSFTKLRTLSGAGTRPVRSNVARRINSQSVVRGAGVILLAAKSAQINASIDPLGCGCGDPKSWVRLPPGGGASAAVTRSVRLLRRDGR